MTSNTASNVMALVATLGLSACWGGDAGTASAAAGGEVAPRKVEACLADAQSSPCDLLSSDVTGDIAPAEATRESSDYAGQHECKLAWTGGRQQSIEVAGRSFSGPVDDELVLGNIRKLADDPQRAGQIFVNQYRNRTTEEKAELAARTAEKVKDQVDGDYQDQATDFASRLINAIEYEPVEGVGEAAVWGGVGRHKQLLVRSGRWMFQTRVSRSNDESQVIADSVALARAVLGACS